VAVAALLDDDDQVVLVRTRRLPEYWQPVGGGLEPGDLSFLDAATRELREELGLSLAHEALRFELSTPYDFGQGEVRFFTARLPRVYELAPNPDEIEECRRFSLSAALELPAYPATQRFLRHLQDRLQTGSRHASRSSANGNGNGARPR
jgi:8-oxo-dGTP pyrophosphatase MutT (NUDIX family)